MLMRKPKFKVVVAESNVRVSPEREAHAVRSQCPKGWDLVLLGDAVGVGQKVKVRRGRVVPGSVTYAREYLAYDPKRVEIIVRAEGHVPAGAEPVGHYGELFVAAK